MKIYSTIASLLVKSAAYLVGHPEVVKTATTLAEAAKDLQYK
jgi:hypothetical protein